MSQQEQAKEHEHLILVMGETGAGKTNFINKVTGSGLQVSHGLQSCTSEVQLSDPIHRGGQKFILVDTPGFNDTNKPDSDILLKVSLFRHKQRKQFAGVVYLHDITTPRMGGTAVHNSKKFKETIGDYAADNVVIVTTKWSLVDKAIGDLRYQQLKGSRKFFLDFIEHGATIVKDDEVSIEEILSTVVKKPLEDPLQEVVDRKKKVNKTSAGKLVSHFVGFLSNKRNG